MKRQSHVEGKFLPLQPNQTMLPQDIRNFDFPSLPVKTFASVFGWRTANLSYNEFLSMIYYKSVVGRSRRVLVVWLQITLHFVQFILINQSAGFCLLGCWSRKISHFDDEVCWTCLLERESILRWIKHEVNLFLCLNLKRRNIFTC